MSNFVAAVLWVAIIGALFAAFWTDDRQAEWRAKVHRWLGLDK